MVLPPPTQPGHTAGNFKTGLLEYVLWGAAYEVSSTCLLCWVNVKTKFYVLSQMALFLSTTADLLVLYPSLSLISPITLRTPIAWSIFSTFYISQNVCILSWLNFILILTARPSTPGIYASTARDLQPQTILYHQQMWWVLYTPSAKPFSKIMYNSRLLKFSPEV